MYECVWVRVCSCKLFKKFFETRESWIMGSRSWPVRPFLQPGQVLVPAVSQVSLEICSLLQLLIQSKWATLNLLTVPLSLYCCVLLWPRRPSPRLMFPVCPPFEWKMLNPAIIHTSWITVSPGLFKEPPVINRPLQPPPTEYFLLYRRHWSKTRERGRFCWWESGWGWTDLSLCVTLATWYFFPIRCHCHLKRAYACIRTIFWSYHLALVSKKGRSHALELNIHTTLRTHRNYTLSYTWWRYCIRVYANKPFSIGKTWDFKTVQEVPV